jgi:hypothetical protein
MPIETKSAGRVSALQQRFLVGTPKMARRDGQSPTWPDDRGNKEIEGLV